MFLQHQVNMTGSPIGLVWQMQHLKCVKVANVDLEEVLSLL